MDYPPRSEIARRQCRHEQTRQAPAQGHPGRLLNLLEHSDKPTQKLIDEITEKKKGTAPDADIRAILGRRTHIELARFRSEF